MPPPNRQARKQDIKRRARERTSEPSTRCATLGCSRPTQRSTGKGLSHSHCKQHVEFHRRHGSYWQKSFTAQQLHPYRKAAQAWLKAHVEDANVQRVITALDGLLDNSGRAESAYRLRGLSPERRASIALARVREAGIRGDRLLEITLTIKATMVHIGPRGDPEFMQVQISKLIHRLASGTHKTPSGFKLPSKYPRAEGRVMRVLGHLVEDIAGIAADAEAVSMVATEAKAAASQ